MHSALRWAAGATDRHSRARTDFAHRFDLSFCRGLHDHIVHKEFAPNAFVPCGICGFLPSIGNFDELEQLGVDSSYADKQSDNSEVANEFRLPEFLAANMHSDALRQTLNGQPGHPDKIPDSPRSACVRSCLEPALSL